MIPNLHGVDQLRDHRQRPVISRKVCNAGPGLQKLRISHRRGATTSQRVRRCRNPVRMSAMGRFETLFGCPPVLALREPRRAEAADLGLPRT
jgi:hypothetical protein